VLSNRTRNLAISNRSHSASYTVLLVEHDNRWNCLYMTFNCCIIIH